jgi:hypothetical protein
MPDRQAIAQQLVVQRAMSVAVLPVDDPEPAPASKSWALGIGKVLLDAARERDPSARLDRLVLAGGHLIGWIEAVQAELEQSRREPE